MRVKRLEIQGFKSFKDKTVVHFDHGITGVVGPNGCGKSNIVDAFFWVMGEQSYKHIRGTSSNDLIFNGSSKYSPSGVAEVTIVLETDFVDTSKEAAGASVQDLPVHLRAKEISVTRRVYRGGEGEYLINGITARLRDIQELFMDTGVGAKGYSVIEQGQIGKVINSKPEDRRLLIEEAAGIAKYKARKKESLRKMEAAQGNMSRITDVLTEIERNLGSLERQAQKARKHKEYKDELIDKEMTWGRRKHLVFRQKIEESRAQKEAHEQEVVGLRAELQTIENSMETDRIAQLTDSKRAEELQASIQSVSNDLTAERSALELSRRRQEDLIQQIQELSSERIQTESQLGEEKERLNDLTGRQSQSEELYQNLLSNVEKEETELRDARIERDQARTQLDQVKKDLIDQITRSSEMTSRAATLKAQIVSIDSQLGRMNEERSTLSERLETVRQDLARSESEIQNLSERKQAMLSDAGVCKTAIQSCETEIKSKEQDRQRALKNIAEVQSRLQSLRELAAAYEGLGSGPKAVMEWANQSGKSELFHVVADLYQVQPGYQQALEGALGASLDELVALEVHTLSDAIDHLCGNRKGRARIRVPAQNRTPGSRISEEELRSRLASRGISVVGNLSEYARVSTASNPAAEMAAGLVSGICVIDSLASGSLQSISELDLGGWNLVTRDGLLIDSAQGLVIHGGSMESDSAASWIGRKAAIEELQQREESGEAALKEIEMALEARRSELASAREQFENLQAELKSMEITEAGLKRDAHLFGKTLQESQMRFEKLHAECESLGERLRSSQEENQSLVAELDGILSSRQDLEHKIQSENDLLELREQSLQSKEKQVQEIRIQEASLRERVESFRREIEAARTSISMRERRLAEISRIIERVTQEQTQYSGSDSGMQTKIEELVRDLTTKQEELSLVRDQLEQCSARINSGLDQIKGMHRAIEEKSTRTNELAVEIEKFTSDLQYLIKNLEEKYGPGCFERPSAAGIQEEMNQPIVTAEMTEEEERVLEEEVERLREKIRRLGEVNTMAIEEYEELKKRYDHLNGEKLDLEKSIQNLQDAIEHINETSKDRFKKAFDSISERFVKLFPIIFGGGSAQLSLVYPEGSTDILEAGVDILAQPPGKRVVNIGLLSGGEKALTAISLIFAIFMVKPSPFCVLDEVDAPLDDSNIGKFNALLRQMADKSQFIVITHNKKTMELNDTLYGVTMEEPGVSKMVSIELQ